MSSQLSSSFAFVDSRGEKVEAVRHKNPDGSLGGWVARNAHVGHRAIVEPGALVEPGATVKIGQRVKRGERIPGPR